MSIIDPTVLQYPWQTAVISLGGGGLAGGIAGFLHGNLGIGLRLVITAGIALIIFAAICFLGPAPGA